MAPHVVAALGEDEAGRGIPVEDRDQDGGVLVAVGVEPGRIGGVEQRRRESLASAAAAAPGPPAQMITWTVPPSTLQAAPAT
jgi:hypothetical protein